MSSSPHQGTLAPIPASCCVCGNAAFPAREGAEAQPDPQPRLPKLNETEVAHQVCSVQGIPKE